MKLFNEWKTWRNEATITCDELQRSVIRSELIEMTKDELCHTLTRFVLEAKKANGEPYPAETLYEIIMSIQMHLSVNNREFKFLNDPDFTTLKNTLDGRMKVLAAGGFCVKRKQAEIISEDEEERMWTSGVLGDDSPQKLLDTVLYLFGLHFALRAGQEHRNLRFVNSQISLQETTSEAKYLQYMEDVSKTRQGGLRHRRIEPKCVRAYENRSHLSRCIVRLYQKYVSHRPTDERCSSAFYLRPLQKPMGIVWYSCQPVGINQLAKTVQRLCTAAGLSGRRTNHSLRATAASRLYAHQIDEQLICETTGHRSSAVRRYKRTNDDQKKAVSETLQLS